MLLPTWNGQNHRRKAPNPRPNWDPITFNYKGFPSGGVEVLWMARAPPTRTHSQYVTAPFLHWVGVWEARQPWNANKTCRGRLPSEMFNPPAPSAASLSFCRRRHSIRAAAHLRVFMLMHEAQADSRSLTPKMEFTLTTCLCLVRWKEESLVGSCRGVLSSAVSECWACRAGGVQAVTRNSC